MNDMYQAYAELLVDYCLDIQPKDRLLIKTTYLAEPLLQAIYALCVKKGAIVECDLHFKRQAELFYTHAADATLEELPPFYTHAVSEFNKFLTISAPFDANELSGVSPDRLSARQKVLAPLKKTMLDRGAKNDVTWTICMMPTPALAEISDMSPSEFQNYLLTMCGLSTDNAVSWWTEHRAFQDSLINTLSQGTDLQIVTPTTDLRLSTKDRRWINSDGRRNMPSGEVFTSPVEDSVSGHIFISYPTRYKGQWIKDVTFTFEQGTIVKAEASEGQDVLDALLNQPGGRRCGEVAFGTNPFAVQATGHTLLDEKIGGSCHIAIGSSYPETGGQNQSPIHLDFVTDLQNGGQVTLDQRLIFDQQQWHLPSS